MTRFILVNPNTNPATTHAMVAIAAAVLPDGVTVEGLTAPFGEPLILDEHAVLTAAQAVASLAPALRHSAPDGIIVSAFADPGLWELRQRLDCPVTGIAEAGMAEAAEGDRPFAVVTTTSGLKDFIVASAERYGHARLFRGCLITPGDAAGLMADPQRLLDALARASETAIRTAGAKAIVIGGGPLATAARALRGSLTVPLIEPVPAAARLTLRRATLART